MSEKLVLLRTIHGSRLYGLNHAESDYDYYTVIAESGHATSQLFSGDDDSITVPWNVFARQIVEGAPQALEALFSPLADPGPLDAYRSHFYPDTANVAQVYRRAMKSTALRGDEKGRRQALRHALNLAQMFDTGRFCPVLTPEQAAFVWKTAENDDEAYRNALEALSPIDIRLDEPSEGFERS